MNNTHKPSYVVYPLSDVLPSKAHPYLATNLTKVYTNNTHKPSYVVYLFQIWVELVEFNVPLDT